MHIRTITLTALMIVVTSARQGDGQTSRPARAASGTSAAASVRPEAGRTETAGVEPVRSTVGTADNTIVRRRAEPGTTTRPAAAVKLTPGGFDTTRVVLSLAIVLGLIFMLRWLGQRLFGKTVAGRSSRAVQVLSRNVISPKQQVLVVQVGRRLLVVGDSGQQMNPLCEITDPDEIAALIGQLHEEQRGSTSIPFGSLFGRAGTAFEKESEPPRPVGVADEDDEGSMDENAGEPTRGLPGDSTPEPPHVQGTRDELSGLMDKVRVMSRQFRRT